MFMFVLKFVVPSVVALFVGGFLGYRWGRAVEAEFQAAMAAAERVGKFVADRVR